MKCQYSALISFVLFITFAAVPRVNAQSPGINGSSGGHSLYGDIRVDESKVGGLKPISLDIILYTEGRMTVSRQTVSSNGRYRFNNLSPGMYDVVVEVEGQEVARERVDLSSPLMGDLRHDVALEWKTTGPPNSKAGTISATDRYKRSSANETLFERAETAIDKKHYDEGAELLQQLVVADPKDFQAWTELGTVNLLSKKFSEAENEYLRALDLHRDFLPALLNLGRLEVAQQRYEVAIEVLTRAIKGHPESAAANRFLGESYLQLKKGSQAVGYLNEAIRLDPRGMAEVHLRLAALYHAAGMKDKAALEYEQFLKQRPEYPDRKTLEKYIAANKKR